MKKLVILFFSFSSLGSLAQTKYEIGMQKALHQWQEGHPKEAVTLLDRVVALDKENWIPVYYKVFIEITEGFAHPQEEDREDIVERNRIVIDQWLSQGGEEWYVLKGLNETLELITDPMNKGMTQSPIISKAYEQAVTLNPNNPRALYSLASFHLNSAKFTQVDIPYYCQLLEKSIELFDQQKSERPFYPSWGKEWAIKTQKICKGKE